MSINIVSVDKADGVTKFYQLGDGDFFSFVGDEEVYMYLDEDSYINLDTGDKGEINSEDESYRPVILLHLEVQATHLNKGKKSK